MSRGDIFGNPSPFLQALVDFLMGQRGRSQSFFISQNLMSFLFLKSHGESENRCMEDDEGRKYVFMLLHVVLSSKKASMKG